MEQITINLSANNQNLTIDKILEITDDTVRYVHAVVDLGDNWEFDSIRAIWTNGISVSTVLNNGECDVPAEVLDHIGVVKVNLVGSDIENNELIDRLPTWQIPCILVKQDVPIDGTDPQPITPSEYEQFVKAVKDNADRAEQGASSAQIYAGMASNEAESASQSAQSAHDDKIAIEQAIAEVIQQIEDFEQVQVVVNTLPPTSPATSDFTDGVLTLGIPQGVKGDTGNGIQSIAKTGTSGLVDTYTITFTDGQTTTFTVTNGAKGDTGNGIASIEKTSTVGLVDTYTITYTNGTTTTFTVTNGAKGDKGEQGDVSLAQLYAVYPTDTASGSIASFLDGADDVPMLSVVADIEPIQSGSGTPSPDNVRPIYGHTEEVVSVSPTTSASDATTYTTQFGQTVYGGSVDLVSGVLTVDRAYTELSEDWYWTKSSSFAGSYYASCTNVSGMKVITPFMSSHAKSVTRLADYVSGCCYCDNSINFRIMSETSTIQDWKDYIVAQRTNGTPITICYELATPTTIQLTPQEINSFKGNNNLWASTGEIEVEYRADIGLYIATHGGGSYDTWNGGSY